MTLIDEIQPWLFPVEALEGESFSHFLMRLRRRNHLTPSALLTVGGNWGGGGAMGQVSPQSVSECEGVGGVGEGGGGLRHRGCGNVATATGLPEECINWGILTAKGFQDLDSSE
jgi:hypothetical protein